MTLLFGLTILLSSFLLFAVQPMISKMILPLWGGTPQVWNTCMLFFQSMLLAGYAYTHLITTRLRLSRGAWLHLFFLLGALWFLPFQLPAGWLPASDPFPAGQVLVLLFRMISLPFFIIASMSPLLQKWYAATGAARSKNPYFLYSASNVGSLGALLAYPIWIEPYWQIPEQVEAWSGCFVLLICFSSLIMIRLWHSSNKLSMPGTSFGEAAPSSWLLRFKWLVFAFIPSSLMLGVTSHMSMDIAAVPLLWIIPLSLYLLTFILAFSRFQRTVLMIAQRLMPYALILSDFLTGLGLNYPVWFIILIQLIDFSVIALYFHSRLAASAPNSARLTEFYLWLSFGGALGGLLNSLAAPVLFKSVLEYPLMLVPAALCFRSWDYHATRPQASGKAWVLSGIVVLLIYQTSRVLLSHALMQKYLYLKLIYFVLPPILAFAFKSKPSLFSAWIFFLALCWMPPHRNQEILRQDRSYFGTHRVIYTPLDQATSYIHGSTIHGIQFLNSNEPTTYFHRQGPAGDFFRAYQGRLEKGGIGVIGLGVGTLIAYAEPGQQWRFFEIDPKVQEIAENARFFTYLSKAKAPYQIVLGDGRLSLGQIPDQSLTALIIDAFSSDSIPVHLLTKEAVEIYFSKIDLEGWVLFNISNRNLRLELVLANLCQSLEISCLTRLDGSGENPSDPLTRGKAASHWVIMTRSGPSLDILRPLGWRNLQRDGINRIPWTDHHSNILGIINWDLKFSLENLRDA